MRTSGGDEEDAAADAVMPLASFSDWLAIAGLAGVDERRHAEPCAAQHRSDRHPQLPRTSRASDRRRRCRCGSLAASTLRRAGAARSGSVASAVGTGRGRRRPPARDAEVAARVGGVTIDAALDATDVQPGPAARPGRRRCAGRSGRRACRARRRHQGSRGDRRARRSPRCSATSRRRCGRSVRTALGAPVQLDASIVDLEARVLTLPDADARLRSRVNGPR